MSETQGDPADIMKQISEALKPAAGGEAACRVTAVDLCLLFRRLMIADPELAMKHAEQIGQLLMKSGRVYRRFKQAAHQGDQALGELEMKRGGNDV